MHAQQAGWSPSELARVTASKGQAVPGIDFIPEATHCPACGSDLKSHKSRQRKVTSLAQGPFLAREVFHQCANSNCSQIVRSETLHRLVKLRQRYAYDLIVYVGLARYLAGKQREEIQNELRENRGIDLSTGTISHLCDRFLCYLECLHLLRAPYLRAAMQDGYPLHLDATCDRGKGGVFVCLDGWRGWVLMATRIESEREDHLRPLVDQTVGLFGHPLAIVRDLGEGGANAVAHLHQHGVADLVCHYHFLAAVGKNLFDKHYSCLRGLVRCSHIRADLCTLLRDLRRYGTIDSSQGRFGPGRVRENLLALVLWVLEGDGEKDAAYPFDLPHLAFVQRCRQTLAQADRWVPRPRSQPERRAVRHLESIVARLGRDQRFGQTVLDLEHRWQSFLELRDVLRLCHGELPGGTTRERQTNLPASALELRRLQEIEAALADYRQQLEGRSKGLSHAKNKTSPEAVILRYLKRYDSHLFGHPVVRDEQGTVIKVVERTNNVLETFFGRSKQRLRRRLGHAHLGRDLEQQPPQVMLVANLEHPEYVRVLCGSLDHLPEAFADLDLKPDAQPSLQRHNRDFKLLGRVRLLLDTVGVSEGGEEGMPASASFVPVTVV